MVHFYSNGVWRDWGRNLGPVLLAEKGGTKFHFSISVTTHKNDGIKLVLMVMLLSHFANVKCLFSFYFHVLGFINA